MRIPDDLSEAFASRHIGLSEDDENKMLAELRPRSGSTAR